MTTEAWTPHAMLAPAAICVGVAALLLRPFAGPGALAVMAGVGLLGILTPAPLSPPASRGRVAAAAAVGVGAFALARMLHGGAHAEVSLATLVPPAVAAVAGDDLIGLATFHIAGSDCELVTLEAFRQWQGVGTSLMAAIARFARRRGCERLWLVTGNDNLDALRFYQRRGLRLVAVHRGAVDQARQIKPAIPLVGEHGIEIHDELELELRLG